MKQPTKNTKKTKPNQNMTPLTISLPQDLYARVEREAEAFGEPPSETIRFVLEQAYYTLGNGQ
jgi:hypothetical protein